MAHGAGNILGVTPFVHRWKVEIDERRVGGREKKKEKALLKKIYVIYRDKQNIFFFYFGRAKNDPYLSRTLALSLNYLAPTPPLLSL